MSGLVLDVLDPAFAPGTGTPETAGMTSRALVNIVRGRAGVRIVSADVVEVSPAYDHAEVTSLAAATLAYEIICLLAQSPATERLRQTTDPRLEAVRSKLKGRQSAPVGSR